MVLIHALHASAAITGACQASPPRSQRIIALDAHGHREIGKGLNDYDAIFTELKSKGFDGWISIEDGVDGMEQLARSVEFLKGKIAQHWG